MGNITRTFLRGLGVILPIVLTVWVLVWLATATEELLKPLFLLFLPEAYYLPGLGLLTGLLTAYAAGVLVNMFMVQRLWEGVQRLIARIPLVKTLYAAFKDFFDFFSSAPTGDDSTVVKVWIGDDAYLIGFVTDHSPSTNDLEQPADDKIAVYLPLSYMIGGITAMVSRGSVEAMDIKAADAMRLVLTAGIQNRR
jgi:uncharacterized membrane protein